MGILSDPIVLIAGVIIAVWLVFVFGMQVYVGRELVQGVMRFFRGERKRKDE